MFATLSRSSSEQAAFAGTVENAQFYIANESGVFGNSSTPFCREHSEPRNSQRLRLQSVLNDHVKIGPVAGIHVLKSAGTLATEVEVPSHNNQASFLATQHTVL